jgi:D-methionine transport system ATP-binding protein
MININQVSKIYKSGGKEVKALDNVSLEIAQGEIFGIIGYSGAGKSTLLRCLNLLEVPTTGEVLIDGQDYTKLKESQLRLARKKIGMIFQHFNLLASRTVFENIAFPLEISGISKRVIKTKVESLLELVGLTDKANAYPSQLSGGQKQRVGIARALANDPKVLLCDEATSALDPQTTSSILELLKDINHKLNLTIILITHEMNVIREICDTVAVMENGQVVELGSVLEVFTMPKENITKEFVKTVINMEIPLEVKNRNVLLRNEGIDGQIIRISFIGQAAGHPYVSALVKAYGIDINILYANIEHIKAISFGMLIFEIIGPSVMREKSIAHLQEQGLQVEVLTHVE